MDNLRFRSDYAQTTEGLSELKNLIRDVFAIDISPLDRLGHDTSVIAFGWWHHDRLIANISLYERQLFLSGDRVSALGVQSVAVRPQWRGKGLFRDLMRRALQHSDELTELMILATETPSLYRPFGFRQIRETVFNAGWASRQSQAICRDLSLDANEDVAMLLNLFPRRAPTSLFASACDHPSLFFLKAALTPEIRLVHLPDLDAIVAIRIDGNTLILLDIVAPKIPTLEDILAHLDFEGNRIELHLTPDRLGWRPEGQQSVDRGYMVRGPFPVEGSAYMFSSMIRPTDLRARMDRHASEGLTVRSFSTTAYIFRNGLNTQDEMA